VKLHIGVEILLLGLLFDSEDGGYMFLETLCSLLTTRHYIPEDRSHSHCREKIKSIMALEDFSDIG
jgi:hypothetical protein